MQGDIVDHIHEIIESIDALEEDAKMLSELVFNSITHSTNETMKSLALLSMVFLPITFLAGIYGMNFDYFPEIHLGHGIYHFWYLAVLMILTTFFGCYRLGIAILEVL